MSEPLSAEKVKRTALECGFEIACIARAEPCADYLRYQQWTAGGMAGELTYLTDHRRSLRQDPRNLLPSARSILCVGKLHNSPYPYSTELEDNELAGFLVTPGGMTTTTFCATVFFVWLRN